jgi:hypothetical protein
MTEYLEVTLILYCLSNFLFKYIIANYVPIQLIIGKEF